MVIIKQIMTALEPNANSVQEELLSCIASQFAQ